MFKNYLKTTLRSFLRHKGYTTLNIVGLAIGIAASMLILQYVTSEFSYDNFHTSKDQIYRVEFDAYHNGSLEFKCATNFPRVGPSMKEEFPEVESFARLFLRYGGGVVRYNDISINEDYVFQADQSFFELFSYPLIEGDPNTALKEPNTAVISEEIAKKYFKEENPIGKRIHFGAEEDYEITGIIRSPENSHLKFNFLLSYSTLTQIIGEDFENAWGWYDFYTYIKVREDADIAGLEAKFPAFIDKHGGREDAHERAQFVLQKLEDIHLKSDLIQEARINGNANSVYFLFTIAVFILIIAWVNYINLSTARALERAREVGIRKAIGAVKTQLIRQFIFESLLLNILAAMIALLILQLSLPAFNNLVGKQIELDILNELNIWGTFLILFILGAFLSGLYPAFVLSSYQPVEVLKGKLGNMGSGMTLRKALVIFQFAASVTLIIGTIVVYKQLSFMRDQELGFQINQTLVIKGPGAVASDTLYLEDYTTFKTQLLKNPKINNVASSTEIPGNLIYWTNGAARLDAEEGSNVIMYKLGVDYDYIENYGHQLIAGRSYDRAFTSDTDSTAVILSRAAIDILGFESPNAAINQQVRIGGDTLTVVGAVENYHQQGLKKAYEQIAFLLVPESRSYYSLKINPDDIGSTLAKVESLYREMFPENPFDYFFLDTFFERQYQSEQQFGQVFSFFAILAIVVASLGLFGLSFFSASQRTKEVGIRKILGSSIPSLLILLSRDFLKLVLLGNLIAWPIAWLIMEKWWLEEFAFRIDVGFWVFLVAGLCTLVIAMITVSYQAIKAALSNPIDALRYE